MIAGAAGAKILKHKSSKHGFPMQKQCFGSVSETFSTAKPCKILKKNKKLESGPLKGYSQFYKIRVFFSIKPPRWWFLRFLWPQKEFLPRTGFSVKLMHRGLLWEKPDVKILLHHGVRELVFCRQKLMCSNPIICGKTEGITRTWSFNGILQWSLRSANPRNL